MSFCFDQIQIIRSKRTTIVLQVKNGQVLLKVPIKTSIQYLQELIAKKQNWITQKLELSRQLAKTKEKNKELDQQTQKLYKTELTKYLDFKLSIFATQIGVTYNKISIKKMTSRWGSCSNKGNLNFSLFLWNTPSFVIDYVIIHELCHRKHMNHSQVFWNLVNINCPNYKDAQKWLKANGKNIM